MTEGEKSFVFITGVGGVVIAFVGIWVGFGAGPALMTIGVFLVSVAVNYVRSGK